MSTALISYKTPGHTESSEGLYKPFYRESSRIAIVLLERGILGQGSEKGGYISKLNSALQSHENGLKNVDSWQNAAQGYENYKERDVKIINDPVATKVKELNETILVSLRVECVFVSIATIFSVVFIATLTPFYAVPLSTSMLAMKFAGASAIPLVAKKAFDYKKPPGKELAVEINALVGHKGPDWMYNGHHIN